MTRTPTRKQNMQTEIQKRFEAVERQRVAIGESALALSNADLRWKPNADAWSVQQIVEHLVLSDETLGRAQDAGAVPNEALVFRILPRALRRALVLAAFQRNAVLPLPSPAIEPFGNVPLPGLLKRWNRSRAKLRRGLETMPPDERHYSHPVLGPLTAGQMLELAQVHIAYHARQMQERQREMA